MGREVAHEVDAAALPGGMRHLGDRGLQPFVGIGDDELDAAQAAAGKLAQEPGPEGFGLRGANGQPQHLAPTIASGRSRKVCTLSSSSAHRRDTWLFEIPVMDKARQRAKAVARTWDKR